MSVCLPARECAATIADAVGRLLELRGAGVIDQLAVVDAASADGTGELAARAGAEVYQEAALMSAFGPVLGKGDAMWRALSVLGGDLICFLDADTEDLSPHFVTGLLGPLVCERGVSFVKAFYRRPLGEGSAAGAEAEGGRVNTLTARPVVDSADKVYTIVPRRLSAGSALVIDGQDALPLTMASLSAAATKSK